MVQFYERYSPYSGVLCRRNTETRGPRIMRDLLGRGLSPCHSRYGYGYLCENFVSAKYYLLVIHFAEIPNRRLAMGVMKGLQRLKLKLNGG
jgi:hypothetical protein